MCKLHLLVDNRGDDDGALYSLIAAFSTTELLLKYYEQLIKDHPNLRQYLYHEPVAFHKKSATDLAYVVGTDDKPLCAFTSEADAIDWADDWFDENPTGDLYGFVVYIDPKYG